MLHCHVVPCICRCARLQRQALRARRGPQVREGPWPQKEPWLQELGLLAYAVHVLPVTDILTRSRVFFGH